MGVFAVVIQALSACPFTDWIASSKTPRNDGSGGTSSREFTLFRPISCRTRLPFHKYPYPTEHRSRYLFPSGVDQLVVERQGPFVADMQDALPAEAVVDRKADPDQRDVPGPGQFVALAVPDQQIRGQLGRFFLDVLEIRAAAG